MPHMKLARTNNLVRDEKPPEWVQRRMAELSLKLKGPFATYRLRERLLDCRQRIDLENFISRRLDADRAAGRPELTPHAVDCYSSVFKVNKTVAVLELSLALQHLSDQEYGQLRATLLGPEVAADLDLRAAAEKHRLVVDECRRLIIWEQQEVQATPTEAQWTYFLKLTVAASHGAGISPNDFSDEVRARNLADRKHRLTKEDSFPVGLADLIKCSARSHRLDLPARDICVFSLKQPGARA